MMVWPWGAKLQKGRAHSITETVATLGVILQAWLNFHNAWSGIGAQESHPMPIAGEHCPSKTMKTIRQNMLAPNPAWSQSKPWCMVGKRASTLQVAAGWHSVWIISSINAHQMNTNCEGSTLALQAMKGLSTKLAFVIAVVCLRQVTWYPLKDPVAVSYT